MVSGDEDRTSKRRAASMSLRDQLPPKIKERLRRLRLKTLYRFFSPRPRWGGLRRTTPFDAGWGRGECVDRVYIDAFIARHAPDIRGDVLEVEWPQYTSRFGQAVVTSHVVDIDEANPRATLVADLGMSSSLPVDSFDCFIMTQTIHLIRHPKVAIENCFRTLRPGGLLLLTAPCTSRVAPEALASPFYDDRWRFTPWGLGALLEEVFAPSEVEVEGFGNLLTTVAFLMGLGSEEVRPREYDLSDPGYPLISCARARKTIP